MAIASHLDLSEVLDLIVRHACQLTGAAYAALGVLGRPNSRTPMELSEFHHTGIDPDSAHAIGHLPRGYGVLGALIENPQPLRLAELSDHPQSVGLPAHHPPMHTFLGVPVRVQDQIFGNLYLCEKAGGVPFSDEDENVVVGLAAAAGIAIENSRLYARARRQQDWMSAAARAATELARDLASAPARIANLAHSACDCTLVAVSIPMVAGGDGSIRHSADTSQLFPINGAAGNGGERLVGTTVTPATTSETAATLFAAPATECAEVWLMAGSERMGILLLHREGGSWSEDELNSVQAFADRVALAVNHARDEQNRHLLAVLQDRDRIAKDLHDHVIQRIFAVGLGIQGMLGRLPDADLQKRLGGYVADLDNTITDIRTMIFSLHHGGERRIRSDILDIVEESTATLGFAPRLDLTGSLDDLPLARRADLIAVIRESLSNVARHAGASAVHIVVDADEGSKALTVEVQDNGKGVPVRAPLGTGLRNAAARADVAGGSFRVGPHPEGGTLFRWAIPLESGEAQ
ncbi:MAG TPA: GAF domain-containing protein [Propionibacteriaceae bacterium]|nr:GAF domain-containing protein [Propionibacteriaceae bacterium]